MTKHILDTTSIMNKASSITLGPNGRLVAIESEIHEPRITKDGVTVIKSLEFVKYFVIKEDRLMNAIASLVKKAANNANKFSGDGTTTTTLLTFELIRYINKIIKELQIKWLFLK
jgi:chaperonin GroEL